MMINEQPTRIAKKQCRKCSVEYEYTTIQLFRREIDFSKGLCPSCIEVENRERDTREKEIRGKIIKDTREQWRHMCGIPERYMDQNFATWKRGRSGSVDKMFRLCKDYAENFPLVSPQRYPSLILLSPNCWGVGKTHLVCAIAHRILDRYNGEPIRPPVRVVLERDLFARIRATYGNSNHYGQKETEDSVIQALCLVPLLIIDDVGKEAVADPRFVQRTLFGIINARYNKMLPVIITANKNIDQFATYLGADDNEASMDRLEEMTNGKFHEIDGQSYRRVKEVK